MKQAAMSHTALVSHSPPLPPHYKNHKLLKNRQQLYAATLNYKLLIF